MAKRAVKPTQLKVLEGNPGKRPLPKDEFTPEPGCKSPPNLNKVEQEQWDYYAPQLDNAGLLAKMDKGTLANFCRVQARIEEISDILNQPETEMLISYTESAPNGTEKPIVKLNPLVIEQRLLIAQVRTMAPDFGMTPRGRVGLSVGGNDKKKNKLEGLID